MRDTVRASCLISAASPARCAVDRLAERVQARRAPEHTLHYDAATRAFRDSLGTIVLPAIVQISAQTDRVIATAVLGLDPAPVAVATLAPPRSPVITAVPVAKPLPVIVPAPPVPVFVAYGPTTLIRIVIGRETPVPVRAALWRKIAKDSQRVVARHARCDVQRTKGVEVVQEQMSPDGELTCWVRWTDISDTTHPGRVEVQFETPTKTTIRVLVALQPILVPRYAVRTTSSGCTELAARVTAQLRKRGVPIVAFERATRRVTLEACDPISKLLPLHLGDVGANGWYIRGLIDERGLSMYEEPVWVGAFEFTETTPGLEPMMSSATQVVERLLRYRPL